MKEPLFLNSVDQTGDNNLLNTDGKAIGLVLWLYSLEPSFYAYLADAQSKIGKIDLRPLKWLGPLVKAVSEIISSSGEVYRQDKL